MRAMCRPKKFYDHTQGKHVNLVSRAGNWSSTLYGYGSTWMTSFELKLLPFHYEVCIACKIAVKLASVRKLDLSYGTHCWKNL